MDIDIARLSSLCHRLSAVYPSDATRAAANEFLALEDPSAALDQALSFLAWQRTLRIALTHLDDAGGDLDQLRMSGERLRRVFGDRRRVWTISGASSFTARQLLDLLTHHKQLLAEPIELLLRTGVDGFVTLSGRGYEAAYPGYTTRAEFDTDVLAPDLEAGAGIASVLHDGGYPVEKARFVRLGPIPKAVFEHRRHVGDHLVSVGVLIGSYHGHQGPIADRSRLVPWRGMELRVPAPEDMLVMLAARVVRKQQFAFVNFNDAAVVVNEEGADNLDWDLVAHQATDGGLESVLAVILEGAERVIGRPVVPSAVWTDLDRPRFAPLVRRMARSVAHPTMNPAAGEDRTSRLVGRARSRLWVSVVNARQVRAGVEPGLLGTIRRRVETAIYTRQLRRVTTGEAVTKVDRIMKRLRPGSGALCELDISLGGGPRCISQLGGRTKDDEAGRILRKLAAGVPRLGADHRCDTYRYELGASKY
ncbi:MAG: nucleotidyltransferase family protein [Acidimicrobiia bacterium]